MNTKTMRLPPRRVLTPSGTTNKRKEREEPFDRPKPITPTTTTTNTSKLLKPDRPTTPRPGPEPIITKSTSTFKGLELATSNQLLAGCLAHEYLTKGTLLGQPWTSAQPEGPIAPEKKKEKPGEDSGGESGAAPLCRQEEERERYAKVAGLLRGGGIHLPGVVNPTQLARYLHL